MSFSGMIKEKAALKLQAYYILKLVKVLCREQTSKVRGMKILRAEILGTVSS